MPPRRRSAVSLGLWEPQIPRRGAAIGLGKIGSLGATTALVQALDDADFVVRALAAQSLGQLGDPEAAQHLLALLQDSDARRMTDCIGKISEFIFFPVEFVFLMNSHFY